VNSEDEVEMVLAALRELQQKVSRPVIRSCLEAAYDDIVHLVGRDKDAEVEADEPPCSSP
jgi:hypothetical protein